MTSGARPFSHRAEKISRLILNRYGPMTKAANEKIPA